MKIIYFEFFYKFLCRILQEKGGVEQSVRGVKKTVVWFTVEKLVCGGGGG